MEADNTISKAWTREELLMRLRAERGPRDRLETLHPAYFAMVMATGIVSIATSLHDVPAVPVALFWLNGLFFAALAAATIFRIAHYRAAFLADVQSHSRGVGFFTTIAAAGVFGSQLVLLMDAPGVALVFWSLAGLLWLVVTYGILAVLTVHPEKPEIGDGLNGGWLVIVVATQSLSILTVLVLAAGALPGLREPLMFGALVLWLGGGVIYLWLMTLIFYRYTFVRMRPDDLTPPYWINMGAVAISTLAGATLLGEAELSPVVSRLATFIEGLTLSFWAIATWWIPMLLVLGVWRYLIRGIALRYDPLYWGGVFPLGMYSVCTYRLTEIMEVPFLMPLAYGFMLVALLAWMAALAGFAHSRFGRAEEATTSRVLGKTRGDGAPS